MTVQPIDDRDQAEARCRLHFHVAVAGAVLTVAAPLVSWGLWLLDRDSPDNPWKRRLFRLAVFDVVLVVALAAANAAGVKLETADAHDRPRIGVVLSPRDDTGVVVEAVSPEGPGARAGLRPGDRVLDVDGAPVAHNEDLVRVVGATEPGHARRLHVERSGAALDVDVTPARGREVAEASRATSANPPRLFDSSRAEAQGAVPTSRSVMVTSFAVEVALIVGLIVVAARRGARVAPGLAVLAAVLGLTTASSVVLAAFRATLGISLGALLVAIASGAGALLVIGAAARWIFFRREDATDPMPTRKAVLLGALYGVGGAVRLTSAVVLVASLVHVPFHSASDAFGLDRSWGPLGIGLFVVSTVLLAPVGEELVFRGVLLPWLARFMRPRAALVWSSVVFAVGHLYYGLGAVLLFYYALILGWARIRTGRVTASITLHAMLNASAAIALLAASR